MDILAAVGVIIGCILVDSCIIMGIWMQLCYDEDGDEDENVETFLLIGFIVNTVLLALLLTATIANKVIQ